MHEYIDAFIPKVVSGACVVNHSPGTDQLALLNRVTPYQLSLPTKPLQAC